MVRAPSRTLPETMLGATQSYAKRLNSFPIRETPCGFINIVFWGEGGAPNTCLPVMLLICALAMCIRKRLNIVSTNGASRGRIPTVNNNNANCQVASIE